MSYAVDAEIFSDTYGTILRIPSVDTGDGGDCDPAPKRNIFIFLAM